MHSEHGPSRATGEGQMIAFVAGLGSLKRRPRTVAKLAGALVLAVVTVAAFLVALDVLSRTVG